MDGRGVRRDVGVYGEVAAGQHDRHAVFSDRAGQQHLVARPHTVARQLPAVAAASLMSATISRSSAIGNPSSMTNEAESHCGRAPDTARSLIVPCTATWPIDPPGKRRGETTYESVENASRSPD